jgi:hypothetical protein
MVISQSTIAELLFNDDITIQERWGIIPNYPNYEASNTGKIRRLLNGRELKLQTDEAGYKTVMLFTNRKKYNKKVARLVWSAFNGYECDLFIDHKDNDKDNNYLDNLRCVTPSENSLNRTDFVKNNRYKLTDDIKRDIIRRYRTGELNTYQINKIYGIRSNYFSMVSKRKTWDKLLDDGEILQ